MIEEVAMYVSAETYNNILSSAFKPKNVYMQIVYLYTVVHLQIDLDD